VTVSLTNKSRRCLVFVLPHDTYCAAASRCACHVGARRVPASLTVPSGLTVGGLDDAVLAVPDVIRAVREGALSVKRGAA